VLEYGQLVKHAQLGLRKNVPSMFIMNPKGFGHRLIEYVHRAFPVYGSISNSGELENPYGTVDDPKADPWPIRHIFMYRSCAKVVESFGSIFSKEGPPPKPKGGGPPPKPTPASEAMKQAAASGVAASGTPKHPLAARLTGGWMDCMLHWMELTGRVDGPTMGLSGVDSLRRYDATTAEPFAKGTDQLEEGSHMTIRMEEYVTKDLDKRKSQVVEILKFVNFVDDADLLHARDVGAAMKAFETHSQAGSAMEKSSAVTGAKFLDPKAVGEVEAYINLIPALKAVGGSNAVLPGSLGTDK